VSSLLKVFAVFFFLCTINDSSAQIGNPQAASNAAPKFYGRFASSTNWNEYKAKGRMRQLEAKAPLSRLTYDLNGRLIKVLEPDPQNKLTLETDFTYDARGNILSITQHGGPNAAPRTRSFIYNDQSQITSETSPEAGTVTYAHDSNGNISSRTDARGITTSYLWDEKKRLLKKQYSDGSPSIVFVYNDQQKSYYSYIDSQDNRSSERSYQYSAQGALYSVTEHISSESYQIGLQYDNEGRIKQIAYPDGRAILQSWSSRGDLKSVTSGALTYFYDATYFSSGDLRSATFGNGTHINRTYNSLGKLSKYTALVNDHVLLSNNYQYTPTGSITGISDDAHPDRSFSYGYDNLQRISDVSQPAGAFSESFQYDSFGNRGVKGSETSQSFNADNRFAGSSGLAYDEAGNMTYDGSHSYTYNAEGFISSIDKDAAVYTYDAEGNRIRKNLNGAITEYIWLDDQLLAQKNPDNSWTDYIYANGERIASTTTSPKLTNGRPNPPLTVYFLVDTFGITRVEISDAGKVITQGIFAPFGEEIPRGQNEVSAPSIPAANISFTGEMHDSETGLDAYKYRSYNPSLGRWMSPDPSGLHFARLDNPQTFNLYSYVTNDPLKYVDVKGLALCSAPDADDDDDTGCADDDDDDGGGEGNGGGGTSGTPIESGSDAIYDPAAGGEVTVTADLDPAIDPLPTQPLTDPITLVVPPVVQTWANKQTVGVAWWSWQYGNWCGKGGAGTPIDQVDTACMIHDYCYSTNGFTFAENYTTTVATAGKAAILQACNQALCNVSTLVYAEGGPTAAQSIVDLFTLTPRSAYACQ
jgi:RHS repeat-associated protein